MIHTRQFILSSEHMFVTRSGDHIIGTENISKLPKSRVVWTIHTPLGTIGYCPYIVLYAMCGITGVLNNVQFSILYTGVLEIATKMCSTRERLEVCKYFPFNR